MYVIISKWCNVTIPKEYLPFFFLNLFFFFSFDWVKRCNDYKGVTDSTVQPIKRSGNEYIANLRNIRSTRDPPTVTANGIFIIITSATVVRLFLILVRRCR